MYTGRVCYGCGGTGKRVKPLTVKEYTDEYAAKLEAKRVERQAKYEAEHAEEIAAAKVEQEKREAEARESRKQEMFKYLGCDSNGKGYILTGNTYGAKEQIKAQGGRWQYGLWVCPVKVEGKGIVAKQIDLSKGIDYQKGIAASIEDALLDEVEAVRR